MQQEALKRNTSQYIKLVLNRSRGEALSFMSELAGSKNYTLLELFDILTMSQQKIGEMWANGTITVADEHFATETALDAINLVSGKMRKFLRNSKGAALAANLVEGEFHTVGLKMFSELLRHEGWQVEFYSSSLSVAQVCKYLEGTGRSFDLICISLTMSFNLTELQSVLKILRTNTLTKNSRIVVGSRLFSRKKARDSLIDNETGTALADCITSNLYDALKFIQDVTIRSVS